MTAYLQGKSPLKIYYRREIPPEKCHRGAPTPREFPSRNKATL